MSSALFKTFSQFFILGIFLTFLLFKDIAASFSFIPILR